MSDLPQGGDLPDGRKTVYDWKPNENQLRFHIHMRGLHILSLPSSPQSLASTFRPGPVSAMARPVSAMTRRRLRWAAVGAIAHLVVGGSAHTKVQKAQWASANFTNDSAARADILCCRSKKSAVVPDLPPLQHSQGCLDCDRKTKTAEPRLLYAFCCVWRFWQADLAMKPEY